MDGVMKVVCGIIKRYNSKIEFKNLKELDPDLVS
jgi:hypothetical protein